MKQIKQICDLGWKAFIICSWDACRSSELNVAELCWFMQNGPLFTTIWNTVQWSTEYDLLATTNSWCTPLCNYNKKETEIWPYSWRRMTSGEMYSGVPKICLSLNCLQSLSIDRSYSVVVTRHTYIQTDTWLRWLHCHIIMNVMMMMMMNAELSGEHTALLST